MNRILRILGVIGIFGIVGFSVPVQALEVSHTAMNGSDSVPAEYFRKWYHRSDLIYYLEALNDHVIVENTTVGQWWQPDRLNIAVAGLPCTMSTYMIDGVRVDDRFNPGNTFFVPNMQQYDLLIDNHRGQLQFTTDTAARDYVQVQYNTGQLGAQFSAKLELLPCERGHRLLLQHRRIWHRRTYLNCTWRSSCQQ